MKANAMYSATDGPAVAVIPLPVYHGVDIEDGVPANRAVHGATTDSAAGIPEVEVEQSRGEPSDPQNPEYAECGFAPNQPAMYALSRNPALLTCLGVWGVDEDGSLFSQPLPVLRCTLMLIH